MRLQTSDDARVTRSSFLGLTEVGASMDVEPADDN